MKLTRRQLRRLITEAFKQKVPLFDPVTQAEIDALRQKGRQDADLSGLEASQRLKLAGLASDEPNVERSLYQALGSTEPEISVEQEQDFLDAQDDYLVDLQDYNIEQALEDVFINGNRDPELLAQLGFVRFGDMIPSRKSHMMDFASYYLTHIEVMLNKSIDDLLFVNDVNSRFFDAVKNFLDNHEHFGNHPAGSGLIKVYTKKSKITDVVGTQIFAVGTMLDGTDTIFI